MTTAPATLAPPAPGATAVVMHGATFVVETWPDAAPRWRLVFLHGWGQDRRAMAPLAAGFTTGAECLLVDQPGFGAAPPPPGPWGTEDYAEALAEWLATLPPLPTLLVGHSFGCRVAIRLAARDPGRVAGLVLIAAAGLQRRRSWPQRLRRLALRSMMRAGGLLGPAAKARLAERFGSADYRRAGAMRPTLVKAVTEDLSESARRVAVPVLLLFGAGDDQTPPEFGERYAALMPDARCVVLPGFDHYTVLGTGRHQVAARLKEFLGRLDAAPQSSAAGAGSTPT